MRAWTDKDVKQLLTGYYNRSDEEAAKVVEEFGSSAALEQGALDAARALVNQLAEQRPSTMTAVEASSVVQSLAQVSIAESLSQIVGAFGELLGDDTGLDRLQQRVTSALYGPDGASVAGAITRAGGQ